MKPGVIPPEGLSRSPEYQNRNAARTVASMYHGGGGGVRGSPVSEYVGVGTRIPNTNIRYDVLYVPTDV